MAYKVVPVVLSERGETGLNHLSHQGTALKVETTLGQELPQGARLLGYYAIDAPNRQSRNPSEFVPGLGLIFEVPDKK